VNGSIVNATMQIRNEEDKYYRIHSKELGTDILVTGSHYIKDSNRYMRVEKFKESRSTDTFDTVVSCIITNDHKIPVGEYTFWDWEDQKVNL
jgi:CBS domain containing-hemolysin-like protein